MFVRYFSKQLVDPAMKIHTFKGVKNNGIIDILLVLVKDYDITIIKTMLEQYNTGWLGPWNDSVTCRRVCLIFFAASVDIR